MNVWTQHNLMCEFFCTPKSDRDYEDQGSDLPDPECYYHWTDESQPIRLLLLGMRFDRHIKSKRMDRDFRSKRGQ